MRTNTSTHTHTDAAKRLTHATITSVSNYNDSVPIGKCDFVNALICLKPKLGRSLFGVQFVLTYI